MHMKKILTLAILSLLGNSVSHSLTAQTNVTDSIISGGIYRSFMVYVPAIYNHTKAVPLVFNLHGLGSNNAQQEFYGEFRPIADTADFILVLPNGTVGANGRGWNNFATPGTGVDDLAFLSALIDTIEKRYSIDPYRIYSTGMSNGGFMSYDLACFMNQRFAAIASVSGSMIQLHKSACSPQHPTPVMEIHGTADPVVSYPGNGGIVSSVHIDSLVSYWVKYNKCNPVPVVTQLPDINTSDGCTAEHQVFSNGTRGSSVELYKIIGGGHSWPGAAFATSNGPTNKDFNASKEIWRFFSQYKLNNLQTGIEETELSGLEIVLYPNPATLAFQINISKPGNEAYTLRLYNELGTEVRCSVLHGNGFSVERGSLPAGLYVVQLSGNNQTVFRKIMFQ
jgi:polyhydroxybutyrate depolymerase